MMQPPTTMPRTPITLPRRLYLPTRTVEKVATEGDSNPRIDGAIIARATVRCKPMLTKLRDPGRYARVPRNAASGVARVVSLSDAAPGPEAT